MKPVFIFLRHGTIPIQAESKQRLPPLKKRALNENGEQQARTAGTYLQEWLQENSVTVARLTVARSRRAEQTAALALPDTPVTGRHALSNADLFAQLDTLCAGLPEGTAAVHVGHGPPFLALYRRLDQELVDLSLAFGAMLFCIREDEGWRLDEVFC